MQFCSLPTNGKITDTLIHSSSEILRTNKPVDLVFYFHGLGTHEGYILPPFIHGGLDIVENKRIYRNNIVFISFHMNPADFGTSPEDIKDVIKNIKLIEKRFNTQRIYLIGTSLGGSVALSILDNNEDKDLKDKIVGTLACFPITDFEYTAKHTKHDNIKAYINRYYKDLGNKNNSMKKLSPINQVSMIKNNAEIILIEGTMDTHIPPPQIENYYKKLKPKFKKIKLVKVNTDHNFNNISKEFKKEVVNFLK